MRRDAIEQLWLNEFVVNDFCGLCANTGFVGPLANETPAGVLVVMPKRPCICPNGRSIKATGGGERRERHV